jgi:hypothetical protein
MWDDDDPVAEEEDCRIPGGEEKGVERGLKMLRPWEGKPPPEEEEEEEEKEERGDKEGEEETLELGEVRTEKTERVGEGKPN